MGKLLLTGVDGNLGAEAAKILLELEDKDDLIFCGYDPASLKRYADMGVETRVTNFNHADGLAEAFQGAERLALISMPFVGPKRQAAHRNAVDAAKAAGVKQIVYTSLVNADDETNPSVEKKDHIYTENYIKAAGLDYIFMRNSQYAEAMVTNYFTFVHMDGVFLEGSEAPFSSDGMVTFAQAIREGKMAIHTDDFQKLTGQEPITVLYMFQHADEFQVGDRHSEDA